MNIQTAKISRVAAGAGDLSPFLSNNPADHPAETSSSSRIGRTPAKSFGGRRNGDETDNGLKKATRSRSKSRSRSTRKRSVSRSRKKKGPRPSDYDRWDFGKTKSFVKPTPSKKNQKAAITLQRWIRGWWVRSNVKFELYRYRLSHKAELTVAAIERVEQEYEKKKELERKKLEHAHKQAKRDAAKGSKKEQHVEEGKDIIAYLRKENKKLRDKNEKIRQAAVGLQEHNERLEGANSQTDGNMGILSTHAKQIQETHDKLIQVEPKYRESVEQLSESNAQHQQYCQAEHSIKMMYLRLIEKVVDLLEDNCNELELTEEVMGHVAAMEGKDNEMDLPDTPPPKSGGPGLQSFFSKEGSGDPAVSADDSDSSSDSEDWDSYSVNQF